MSDIQWRQFLEETRQAARGSCWRRLLALLIPSLKRRQTAPNASAALPQATEPP